MSLTTEQEVQRGHIAQALLDNELLREAFRTLKDEAVRDLVGTDPRNIDARENHYATHRGLELAEQRLRAWMQGARLQAERVERQQQRRQPLKR